MNGRGKHDGVRAYGGAGARGTGKGMSLRAWTCDNAPAGDTGDGKGRR